METENNKLIAEFMGLAYCEKYRYEGWYRNSEFNHRVCDYNGLQYHSSWDWLMPVVEKIESLGYDVNIKGITCSVNRLLETETIVQWVCGNRQDKIGLVYKTVVEFINWYNENN